MNSLQLGKRVYIFICFILISATILSACATPTAVPEANPTEQPASQQATEPAAAEPVELVAISHWGEQRLTDNLEAKFAECEEVTNVKVEHQPVAYEDLIKRITTGRISGSPQDIYHYLNIWAPEFATSGVLDPAPADVIADLEAGYPGTVEGARYNGQLYGYPTEITTYALIYNKALLKEAGVDKPPATWAELREVAKKTTKKDANGEITQAGFILLTDWDSGSVHPFLSLMQTNGGEFVQSDLKKVHFNEESGVEALQLETDLINDGSVKLGWTLDDFVAGKAAMIIWGNWWGAILRDRMEGGWENVGTAPLPLNNGTGTPTSVAQTWVWGVDANSPHKAEAWKFLKCLNSPMNGGSSPMGDFLTTGIYSIPGRKSDQEAHQELLTEPFYVPFVNELSNAQPERIFLGGQEIKTLLYKAIEQAWYGIMTPEDTLNAAADQANAILGENYP